MPVIFRSGPYTIRFFSNENGEPPHVHVDRPGCTAKIWLLPEPSVAIVRGYAAHELRLVLKLVAENAQLCLESWYRHFGY